MIRHLGWPALAVSLLCAPVAFPSGSDQEQKGEAMLVRPAGAPDPDAKGKVEIEHHDGAYEEAFEVEAEHLDPSGTYEVFLEDGVGTGTLLSIGFLSHSGSSDPSGDDGDDDDDGDDEDEEEFELEFDTEDGDALPFGVMFSSELTGRRIEVRSGGQVYLEGVVPALGVGDGDDPKLKIQSQLMRPPSPPDADAKGKVELKEKGSELEFEVEAEELDAPGVVYSVWLEEPAGSGLMQDVGAMSASKSSGSDEWKLELETEDGESLPFGVNALSALAGRTIEVRGNDGKTYLTGFVPTFGATTVKASDSLAGSGKGEVKVRRQGKTGAQEFGLKLKKQGKKKALEVWIENPASGTLELAATLVAKKSGRASWKVKTKKGHALPFGVLKVDDLGGRPLEVRDVESGVVRMTGTVPTPD